MHFRRMPLTVYGVALTVGVAPVLGHHQKHVEKHQHQNEPVPTFEYSFSTTDLVTIPADNLV